ncbi:MAG: NAD(P)-binding domain-containing protein, partial [Paracoccus sp. (in: a-proteobacteria)]|nr:NAD(P)-binding domain-containing protein [Paracoccus sp. (in: a-proteobacteria)]
MSDRLTSCISHLNVAILGADAMGTSRRLANAGYRLQLWDPADTGSQGHIGQIAASPAIAVKDADVIITTLPEIAMTRHLLLDHSVLEAAAPG